MLFSKSSFDEQKHSTLSAKGNLMSSNYKIIESEYFNDKYLLIKIVYPDCNNYEGIKILLFENCTLQDLLQQRLIDPHFSDNKSLHSPIARFEPILKGWFIALKFINSLK